MDVYGLVVPCDSDWIERTKKLLMPHINMPLDILLLIAKFGISFTLQWQTGGEIIMSGLASLKLPNPQEFGWEKHMKKINVLLTCQAHPYDYDLLSDQKWRLRTAYGSTYYPNRTGLCGDSSCLGKCKYYTTPNLPLDACVSQLNNHGELEISTIHHNDIEVGRLRFHDDIF